MINGDVWTDFPVERLRHSLAATDLAHLVLVPNPAHNARGDFCLEAGRIQDDGPLRYTFSGLGVYRPELFAGCSDGIFKLAPLLRAAARQGRVSGELYEGTWLDIGTPEWLAALDQYLRAGD